MSLVDLTSKSVYSLMNISPERTASENLRIRETVKQVFFRECCKEFDLDLSMPSSLAALDVWWGHVTDIYQLDALVRDARKANRPCLPKRIPA